MKNMRKYPSNFLRINISTFVSWNRPSYCCSMFHAINSENGKCRTKKQKQSWESEEIIEHEPNISLLTFVNQMEVGLTCKIVQMSSCSCIFDVYSTYSSMRKMNAKRQVGVEGWWRSWNKLEQKSMNPPVDRVKLNRKTLFSPLSKISDSERGRLRWMDRQDLLELSKVLPPLLIFQLLVFR